MFRADRLDHVGFVARDVETLARWYETVFGMARVHADVWPDVEGGHPVMLCARGVCVALFSVPDAPEREPGHKEHFALAVDRANFEQAQLDFDELGIDYEVFDFDICDSIFLADPEGHQIELTCWRA
jgi:catechol 2,3-dioxygenase-like lactoylglutathione lyase family enzyme